MKIIDENMVKSGEAILLVANALRYYDDRLVDHGARVAYIADLIFNELGEEEQSRFNYKDLILLSLFHDIGAYKTEEIDKMVEFESDDVDNHSIFGYLFLKYFTPLKHKAKVLRYHHTPVDEYDEEYEYKHYSALIHLADRVDVLYVTGHPEEGFLDKINTAHFDNTQVEALKKVLVKGNLSQNLDLGIYNSKIYETVMRLSITPCEMEDYLKMLIHSIDFKSAVTMVHSVDVTVVSCFLAEKMGFTPREMEKVYVGSMVHDIGKIKVPVEILEYPGKLTPEQWEKMKMHVVYTDQIVGNLLPQDVRRIASRHHEKLNGKGYPDGLSAKVLTTAERIVAVADIISALLGKRSYKEGYDMNKAV